MSPPYIYLPLGSSKFVTLSLIYHLIDFLKKNLSNILNAINDNDDNNNDDNNNNNDEIVLPLFEQDVQLFEKIMVLFLIITLFFINQYIIYNNINNHKANMKNNFSLSIMSILAKKCINTTSVFLSALFYYVNRIKP